MQGFERMDRQLLDAAALAGHLVPAGSMFAFLAGHRAEVFPDAGYADLFSPPGVGRPSLPTTQMAAVLTLQALHDYSDRETAEAVRFDMRWKVAIGASLDDPGFDPSSLVYWRRRLAKSGRPHRVNDAVKTVIEQTGILTGRRRRAVDSTILADAVATQDTVTQLISAIRRVAREVPGAAGQIAAVCTGHDYSKPGKPKIDWDDPAAKDALVSALVNDANALVAALQGQDLDEPAASAVALLALVAGQDVEPAEGSDGTDGRWRIARKVAGDRVISTADPEAWHTRKSPEARRDGYRAHVAGDPETGIITDEKLTGAAGAENSDAAVAAEFVAAEAAAGGDGTSSAGGPGNESALDTFPPANRPAAVSPMGGEGAAHNLVTTGRPFSQPRLTATVTATAAANGNRQRSAAPKDARTSSATLGYIRPVKADGRGSAPFRRDCSQDAEQHPTHVDNSGISAQPTTIDGRSWTTCPLLRIRCSRTRCVARWGGQRWEPTVPHGSPAHCLTCGRAGQG